MDKIAVFLDEFGKITTFVEAKKICIYIKEDSWKVIKEINIDMKQLNDVKSTQNYVKKLTTQMEDSKIVIVSKASGVAYSIFYEQDFSVWELQGEPTQYLDSIIIKEYQHLQEEENNENIDIAKEIKEGHLLIDLIEIQMINPEMSSKRAIKPYLEKKNFDTLEIRCCHIPPWLEKEALSNKLIIEDREKLKRNEYKVIIRMPER